MLNANAQQRQSIFRPVRPRHTGTTIAVWGTSGAPGRSTLAFNIAYELAASAPVILIDADLRDASIAHMAGIPTQPAGLANISRAAIEGTLSDDVFTRALVPYAHGLRILTGLMTPAQHKDVSAASLEAILLMAARHSTWVVVDVASLGVNGVSGAQGVWDARDGATASILRTADNVLCVARGDVIGISRLARTVTWWNDAAFTQDLRIVVNRVSSTSCGAHPFDALSRSLDAIIPGRTIHVVPEDRAVAKALLDGSAISAIAARADAALAVTQIVEGLRSARASREPVRKGASM